VREVIVHARILAELEDVDYLTLRRVNPAMRFMNAKPSLLMGSSCSPTLLCPPALTEWRRLLKSGETLDVSRIRAGFRTREGCFAIAPPRSSEYRLFTASPMSQLRKSSLTPS
jgi:hypothetical protein